MIRITAEEFKNNYDHYVEKAETERIEVTKRGVVIFTMVPKREELGERIKTFFGTLPPEASIGDDPYERG